MSAVMRIDGAWYFHERLDAISWLQWPVHMDRPTPFETIVFVP